VQQGRHTKDHGLIALEVDQPEEKHAEEEEGNQAGEKSAT
jgi:hypothetical protein